MKTRNTLTAVLTAGITLVTLLPALAYASVVPHARQLSGHQVACTLTNPEYLFEPGGAAMKIKQGTTKFTAKNVHHDWESPYVTAGYNQSLNSTICNSHALASGAHARSFPLPAQLGHTGKYYSSAHDWTSKGYSGNAGYDIWLTRNPANNSYSQLVNQGGNTTEVMIWLSHPISAGYHKRGSVKIDGMRWDVQIGYSTPRGHHGASFRRKGWTVINFISPDTHSGSVSVRNLYLNSFLSYAAKRHALNPRDYLMAIDQGGENVAGTLSVLGYSLTRR